MSLTARVTYSTYFDPQGTGVTRWIAKIKLARPYVGLSLSQAQAYQQQIKSKSKSKDDAEPLTDTLSVKADTLDEARQQTAAAVEALTGLNAFSTRYIDLQEFHAQPAACEEFKVASEQRKAA